MLKKYFHLREQPVRHYALAALRQFEKRRAGHGFINAPQQHIAHGWKHVRIQHALHFAGLFVIRSTDDFFRHVERPELAHGHIAGFAGGAPFRNRVAAIADCQPMRGNGGARFG